MQKKKQKLDLFTIDRIELDKIVSDPTFIKPINFYFLLALPIIEEETSGGIIIPRQVLDTSSHGNNIGRIVGIGSTVGGCTGAYAECRELKIGDYIGYNPNGGLPQHHDNYELLCIRDEGFRTRIYDITKHTDGIFNTYKVHGVA